MTVQVNSKLITYPFDMHNNNFTPTSSEEIADTEPNINGFDHVQQQQPCKAHNNIVVNISVPSGRRRHSTTSMTQSFSDTDLPNYGVVLGSGKVYPDPYRKLSLNITANRKTLTNTQEFIKSLCGGTNELNNIELAESSIFQNGSDDSDETKSLIDEPVCSGMESLQIVDCKDYVTNGKLRKKKSVRFSDDLGQPLTTVTHFESENNLLAFIEAQKRAMKSASSTTPDDDTLSKTNWYLTFQQPAQDYVNFKNRISLDFVSLANCFVTGQDNIRGTVRVKDIAFQKTVFIRLTWDNWSTHVDQMAIYSDSISCHDGKMDNFTFSFKISNLLDPPSNDISIYIEFAVCFQSNGQEYWDNNYGQNYRIRRTVSPSGTLSLQKAQSGPLTADCKPNYSMFKSLTAFRSWNHFTGETSFY